MSDVGKVGPGAPPRKSAVILAGAAGKGPFAAGALGVVAKHEKQFDIVCVVGTSSGALNAAVFAAGLRVDRAGEAAELLEGLWKDTANALHIATMCMRVNIVKKALKEFWKLPEVRPVKLRIALTTLDGKEAFVHRRHYTTHEAIRHFQGADFATEQGIDDIARHAVASAAIPFIFAPVRLDGTTYVDGGVVDNAPIAWALDQDEEIEDLLVITSDPRVTARPRRISRFPFSPVLNVILSERLTRDLLHAYSFNKELKQLEAMGVDMQRVRRELKWRQLKIVEIRPPQETPGSFVTGFFCKSQRIANLDAGTAAATKALEERLQCPVQPPPPPPPAPPSVQSQHLRKSSELLLIAPIKQGLVPVPFTVTYAVRLKLLLEGLFALRQAGVERFAGLAKLTGPLETVTSLHFVQWAILDEGTRLLLAVTFEGPWEAYIRGIVDNAGPFLDSIFCHCEGYSDGSASHATANGYDGFARWVRQHQVQVNFFHSAAPDITANDIAWLRELNGLRTDPEFAVHAAELSVPPPGLPQAKDFAKETTFVQVLSAFFTLSEYFAPPDNVFLEKAASTQLQLLIPDQPALKGELGAEQDAWDWYAKQVLRHRKPANPIAIARVRAPETVQGNILNGYGGMVDGLLVFLQFSSPKAGAEFLAGFRPTTEGAADALARNIALTFAGFVSLGLGDLADLPEEFREGMELRAPMLGDIGINDPYFWERPIARGPAPGPSSRVDLSTIHAVVIFQWGSAAGEALLEQARADIEIKPAGPTGVRILAEQRLHRNRPGATFVAPFGFVDGVSQPVPRAEGYGGAAGAAGDVALGELLLGYENERGEKPRYAKPAVFRNGSFLAMRKIRQDVRAFQDFLDGAGVGPGAPASPEELAGKIMGRTPDGTPLALGAPAGPSNNFDYTSDAKGLGCPLSAHIRRANPRVEGTPRISRRGFSYHERVDYEYEEGLVFMAYCASLSSQYEVVQKWVNGGNSTGTYGGQVDPMFAVPGIGDSAFIYPDPATGDAVQVTMPPEALVSLKWGLYLFAPSTEGLTAIAELALETSPENAAAPAPGRCPFSGTPAERKAAAFVAGGGAALEQVEALDPAAALDQWRVWIEEQDEDTQDTAAMVFAALRARPEFDPTPYGILISQEKDSLALFADRDSSVCEYGKRMTRSYGLLTLGQDPGGGYEASAPAPNGFISKIDRVSAYEAALDAGRQALAQAPEVVQPGTLPQSRRIVDLGVWADLVLCQLVKLWLGFPDPGVPEVMRMGGSAEMSGPVPCCPDDFRVVSGYIFQAQPTDAQTQSAQARGALIAAAGATFTKARRQAVGNGQASSPLTLIDALLKSGYMGGDEDATSRAWIGAVSGFTVPTGGSFERVMGAWLAKELFWQIQGPSLALQKQASRDFLFESKGGLLAGAVIQAFQEAPVPFALHRRVKANRELRPGVVATPDTAVVILTTSVGQALGANGSLDTAALFGGVFDPKKPPGSAIHACPGREMALGVIMGLVAAVFERTNVYWEGELGISYDY